VPGRFHGRLAIVTGASMGIGLGIAQRLGAEDADVLLLDVDTEAGERAAAAIGGSGVKTFRACDVSSDDDVRSAAAFAQTAWTHVDFLVNNAGIFPRHATCDMTEAQWRRVIDVNLGGAFHCVKYFVPLMRSHSGAGIVTISSGRALEGAANGAAYSATKAGLLGLTRALAREFAPLGIRVNALVPGITDTAQPRQEMSDEQLDAAGRALPLGRIGLPVDIARGVAFLLSDDASYMTGQKLVVNGGAIMA
jgi:NAD(P)-dependent dehydrogenase (short-subunit alcohol dehydrogenase family)